ncbi:hypothetical protein [Rodentibacter caecimuris]|uniref:hypothetical protein n=1 Tax=Rodentibacter caecimuris TaxID=1796644 RepID=UPI00258FF8A8|nr:hypothetical protein [Rodentibacter heylii]
MFVVGWNREQGDAFTVETLDDHIRYNLDAFYENTTASWAMVGVFDTHEQATEFCSKLQAARNERLDKSANS